MAFENNLEELKARLHILHTEDDDNLQSMIDEGYEVIKGYCGNFEKNNPRGKKLVFEYVRFAYNGMTEHFYSSFRPELVSFGFELMDVDEYAEET